MDFGTSIAIYGDAYGNWSDWWKVVYTVAPVTNLSVQNYNTSCINLSWTRNTNDTYTYIRFKKNIAPSSRTDGTFLVNTTNVTYNHTGLDAGTHYYYSIWSYNTTDNEYSYVYESGSNYTNPDSPTSLQETAKNMTTITLQWLKGINATKSVVFCNASGETGFPTRVNGSEVLNVTNDNDTVSGLTENTTYWFTVYSFNPDSGLWSESNSTDNATTNADAGGITSMTASRYNDVQLNLSWVKSSASDETVVVRKTGSYPANPNDGTKAYNGSLLTYKDTGRTPATKYYYRAWAWNGETYGDTYASDSNSTRPSPPTEFIGSISGDNLVINWTKGGGAARTLIRNNTDSYPANTSDGTLVYNDTGTTTTVSDVSDFGYYRSWSYVVIEGEGVYSYETDLVWGGIEINVYKEDNPSVEIGNYTVFITNSDASETYENTSVSNPFRIDVSDVPNGEDITIQIQKEGYKTRSQTLDLFENIYYTINFYLPPSDTGSPSGESGEEWYVNGSDLDNETTASHYIITVVDEAENEVFDAFVDIKKYINTSDSYETVLSGYTDSSGQISADLIHDVVYYVIISKTNYDTTEAFWTPPEITQYEDTQKKFILHPASTAYPNETGYNECVVFEGGYNSTTGFVNLSNDGSNSICGSITNYSIYIYRINTTTNITTLITCVNGTNQSVNITFDIYDLNNTFYVSGYINHEIFGGHWNSFYINPSNSSYIHTDVEEFEGFFDNLFGGNSLGWSAIFGIFTLLACLFAFGQRNIGLGILLTGIMMLGINAIIGLLLLNVALCVVIVVFGILVQWKITRREVGG